MPITSRTAAMAAVVLVALTWTVDVETTAAKMVVPAAAPAMGGGGVDAPAPGPDCSTILLNASDCLTFFSPGSNETVPDPPCCPEVKALVSGGGAGATCLCDLLENPKSVGFDIDVKKALKLPSLCGIHVNPAGLCALLGIHIPTSNGPAMSPGPGGATTSPLTSPPGNGASSIPISHNNLAVAVGLALAFQLSSLM